MEISGPKKSAGLVLGSISLVVYIRFIGEMVKLM
jgi:hypothetical protein